MTREQAKAEIDNLRALLDVPDDIPTPKYWIGEFVRIDRMRKIRDPEWASK